MTPAPMPADYLEAAQLIASKIASKATGRLGRRGRASDPNDLRQQCLLYCLEIFRCGGWHDGIEGYRKICWVHCYRRIGLYSTRQQAPVTCGRDSEVKKQLPRTIVSKNCEIAAEIGDMDDSSGNHSKARYAPNADRRGRKGDVYFQEALSAAPIQEREAEIGRTRARIRARMEEIGGNAPGAREALAGWLDGVDPADAVAQTGAALQDVYGANKRLARAAREDGTLRSLALALALARGMAVEADSEYVGVA